jgi:hypothetical protein
MGKNKIFFLNSELNDNRSWTNITTNPVVEKVVKIARIVNQNIKPLFFLTKERIKSNRFRKI